jgi:hypothetical protein
VYGSTTLSALATLGAHSPTVQHCLHWLHLEPTHPEEEILQGAPCFIALVAGKQAVHLVQWMEDEWIVDEWMGG